jgi:hypothetical protein
LTTAFKKNVNQNFVYAADLGHYIAMRYYYLRQIDGQNRSKKFILYGKVDYRVVCKKIINSQ